jgi:3-deoxy-manno-octulosonate cytidylyltransferase (CMP-KDO synthetase)
VLVADSPDQTARAANPRIVALIPARYESSRLPGKALAPIDDRPMIEHVYRRVSASSLVAEVIVATDDERIARVVEAFGGRARMTKRSHTTGTERVAEVAESLACDIVVNVQGDEPLVEPAMIDEAVAPLLADPSLEMGSLRRVLDDPADLSSPHVVKVVVDRQEFALYFSRAPLPYRRAADASVRAFKHIGLYVYRRAFLIRLAGLPPTPLEQSERLEQLRALEHGFRIKVVETAFDSIGVDTPADLERVRRLVTGRPSSAAPVADVSIARR